MSFRGFDHIHSPDLSALLAAQNSSSNNASVASVLLGPQQNVMPSLMSLAGFSNASPFQNQAQPPAPQTQNHQYQSQTTHLLTALIEQQQREDQKKAALIQQLNDALYSSQSAVTSPADALALMLQQKQFALSNQSNANALAFLAGAPLLSGVLPGSNIYGGPSRSEQIDAFALAKLLQSQQQPPQATAPEAQVPVTTDRVNAAAVVAPHLNTVSATPPAVFDIDAAVLALPAGRKRKGRTGTFPQKLHQMLSDLERQDCGTDIASFLPHGRAFAIHKPRDFVKHVMPKYFRMSRFSSFQRQLNLYDFQRITEGPDKGSYYHELFLQGRPILSTMMKRNKIKGVKILKRQDAEQNPSEGKDMFGRKDEEIEEEEEEEDELSDDEDE